MSEQDDASKTEEPTPKKLQDARNKGQIPQSKEIGSFGVLVAFAVAVAVLAPFSASMTHGRLKTLMEQSGTISLDIGNTGDVLMSTVLSVLLYFSPIFATFIVVALAVQLGQVGFLLSAEPIIPKLSKISPIAGVKRLVSVKSLVEFLKGLAKMGVVGLVAYIAAAPEFDRLEAMIQLDVVDILLEVQVMVIRILLGVLIVLFMIAALDYAYQTYEHIKQNRMTRQEVRDEHKQAEGDPHVKARLRQIRADRARQRMMASVPKADVVITNPTHFAIALSYNEDEMVAPVVVAKGADDVAFRIREVANDHGVPIVENKPLAQALFATVEIDQQIPPEHYQAVAQVISYVYKLKGKFAAN
ncbi:MAG: flagellar biosynthesis protein FlhB [Alphaproteobacteria bacterium]|nr:flagellar biosynthesis protein FlhB [Alphaproteobacteria bacterium]